MRKCTEVLNFKVDYGTEISYWMRELDHIGRGRHYRAYGHGCCLIPNACIDRIPISTSSSYGDVPNGKLAPGTCTRITR
jgi:hypothetical protein